MPATTDDRVDLLAKRCDSDLGDPDLWFRPDGYPHSLALCIIDSIASTGAHYNSVKNLLRHYIEYRQAQGGYRQCGSSTGHLHRTWRSTAMG